MASDNMKHRRLQELGESDFEIVEGQPDIRGWDVKTTAGETIGEVDELILDAQARKVRYMVVDLDDDALHLDDSRRVLIPIGLAELHENDDDVIVPGITADQLTQLPEYDEDNLDPAYERQISTVFGRADDANTTGATDDLTWYQHEHFNEQNLYKRRLLPQNTAGTTMPKTDGVLFQRKDEDYEDDGLSNSENRYGSNTIRNEVEDESLQAVRNSSRDSEIDRTDDLPGSHWRDNTAEDNTNTLL